MINNMVRSSNYSEGGTYSGRQQGPNTLARVHEEHCPIVDTLSTLARSVQRS